MRGHPFKYFLTFFFLGLQSSWVNAGDVGPNLNNAMIVSPNVLIIKGDGGSRNLKDLTSKANNIFTVALSWTDSAGHRSAKVEIVSVIYDRVRKQTVLKTRQWLPYTLSGEIVSLPVVLNNVNMTIL